MRLRGPQAVIGARDHASFVARHARHVAQHGLVAQTVPAILTAYVNHGRWIADCPQCNSGLAIDRAWPDARCLDCGAIYTQILWPAEFDTIEDVLLRRPLRHQHWRPGETVDQLQAENLEHRVGGGS